MHKLLKSQVAIETTIAQREVSSAVLKMVHSDGEFRLASQDISAEIEAVVANCKNVLLKYCINAGLVGDITGTVISNGYGKLAPLQSIAARVVGSVDMDLSFEDKYHIAIELTFAVAQVSEYMRLVHTDGTYYIVSEYQNRDIDMAVYNAAHPMPSLVVPKPLVDIHSNAYRSDSGYNVMLGTKLNEHEDSLPLDILNYLGSIAYSIEPVAHPVRPAKVAKPKYGVLPSQKVKEQLEYCSGLHTEASCNTIEYLYGEGNKFYFPHSFEKRLRIFSKGHQINLQGDEYDKSVLEFAKAEKLTAEGYENLLVATANAYGLDKLSFTSRIMWCYEHMDMLEDMEADEPLIYAKCVRAIRKHKRGEAVAIPMHIDATASGLQINGCLTACRKTLVETNAIGNADDERKDIYTNILNFMSEKLPLLKDLSRKEVKNAAVPAIYGSEAEPEKVFEENADVFWQAFEQMKGAYWYLRVLPQLWRDDITEYTFTMPDGYKIYIPVTGDVETEVFIECIGENMTITREVIGRKAQSKCFLAAITHSLDAYMLRNIVRKCKAHGIDIMCIHDSFGVHPNYAGMVAEWYRIELANLVKLNPLPKMLQEIFGVKVVLPNYGYDREELAKEILQSTYALC